MIKKIDLSEFGDGLVFHYGGEYGRISAQSLSNSLLEFSEALKEINRTANPGLETEIFVQALGHGSFRVEIKIDNVDVRKLLGKVNTNRIWIIFVLLMLGRIAPDTIELNVVSGDQIKFESAQAMVFCSREIYDKAEEMRENDKIEERLSRGFKVLEKDASITNFGVTQKLSDKEPLVKFDRDDFPKLSAIREQTIPEEHRRRVEKEAELLIIRAIFERGPRMWQFSWHENIKISASILSDEFFDKLEARDYIIGEGDTLQVKLRIHQTWDKNAGVWLDESYEIIQVLGHFPGLQRKRLL